VAEGDAVVLACSLYRHSLPVHINWLDADTYDLISLDQFTAISDNSTNYWFISEHNHCSYTINFLLLLKEIANKLMRLRGTDGHCNISACTFRLTVKTILRKI